MFAVYVLCGAQEKDAVRLTLEQIDVVRRMCTEYQDFEIVTSSKGTGYIKIELQAIIWLHNRLPCHSMKLTDCHCVCDD